MQQLRATSHLLCMRSVASHPIRSSRCRWHARTFPARWSLEAANGRQQSVQAEEARACGLTVSRQMACGRSLLLVFWSLPRWWWVPLFGLSFVASPLRLVSVTVAASGR